MIACCHRAARKVYADERRVPLNRSGDRDLVLYA